MKLFQIYSRPQWAVNRHFSTRIAARFLQNSYICFGFYKFIFRTYHNSKFRTDIYLNLNTPILVLLKLLDTTSFIRKNFFRESTLNSIDIICYWLGVKFYPICFFSPIFCQFRTRLQSINSYFITILYS
jgi:hypothetical protein